MGQKPFLKEKKKKKNKWGSGYSGPNSIAMRTVFLSGIRQKGESQDK